MPGPDSPNVLQLVVDSLTRFETKLDRGLERLETRLEGKADKSDLTEIRGELTGQAKRISDLERSEDLRRATARVHRERDERSWFARSKWMRVVAWGVGTLLTAAIAAASLISALAAIH